MVAAKTKLQDKLHETLPCVTQLVTDFYLTTEPSGPPQDIHALTLSSTSIRVEWSPPLDSERNGIIIRYTVQYTSQTGETNSVDTPSTRTVVKGLDIFMRYSFTVKAWNVVGAGPKSKAVFNTTLEDSKYLVVCLV